MLGYVLGYPKSKTLKAVGIPELLRAGQYVYKLHNACSVGTSIILSEPVYVQSAVSMQLRKAAVGRHPLRWSAQ